VNVLTEDTLGQREMCPDQPSVSWTIHGTVD
jgi:hypothetical protein